jgi:hypothetical protein
VQLVPVWALELGSESEQVRALELGPVPGQEPVLELAPALEPVPELAPVRHSQKQPVHQATPLP